MLMKEQANHLTYPSIGIHHPHLNHDLLYTLAGVPLLAGTK